MSWLERFDMDALPLPRGAAGASFFEGDPHYQRLAPRRPGHEAQEEASA